MSGVDDEAAQVLYRIPRRRLGGWGIGLGAGLLMLAALVMGSSSYFASWTAATATVAERGEHIRTAGKSSGVVECSPVLEYRAADGSMIRASSISARSAATCYAVGQEIAVAVDPEDASRVLILEEDSSAPIALFSAVAGLVLMAAGIWALVSHGRSRD